MLVACSICATKFVTSTNDITATPCGHIFHFSCLIEWIQRSKSCPQCRCRTTEKNLLKLYPDDSNEHDDDVDVASLQNTIDGLKFQVTLKEQELKVCKEKIIEDRKYKENITEAMEQLERECSSKRKAIGTLKAQIEYNAGELELAKTIKTEYKNLQSKIKSYETIRSVIEQNEKDINSVVNDNNGANLETNLRNLATISCLLQKSMATLAEDKRQYRDQIITLKNSLRKIKNEQLDTTKELNELKVQKAHLETDIQSLEYENKNLTKKLSSLQDSIISPSGNVKNSVINRLLSENATPVALREIKNGNQSISDICITPEVSRTIEKKPTEPPTKEPKPKKDTAAPYLQMKSSAVNPFARKKIVNAKASPVFRVGNLSKQCKKPFIGESSDDFGYDGLGGHHIAESFPKPIRQMNKKRCIKVVSNSGSTKKFSTESIKDFFKNTFDE